MTRSATPLRISASLSLPLEAITETVAILGIRGSGKNAGVFPTVDEAAEAARKLYPSQAKPKGPAKQSASDDEAFAAMARAMANGFDVHEPAYSAQEIEELRR